MKDVHSSFESSPVGAESPMRTAMRIATTPEIVRLAMRMSLVVGTLLNLINQGSVIFQDPKRVHFMRLGLTYVVPYCVATYSAVRVSMRRT